MGSQTCIAEPGTVSAAAVIPRSSRTHHTDTVQLAAATKQLVEAREFVGVGDEVRGRCDAGAEGIAAAHLDEVVGGDPEPASVKPCEPGLDGPVA